MTEPINQEAKDKSSPPETQDDFKRTSRLLQVAGLIHRIVRPAFYRHNYCHAMLMMDWDNVIGPRYGKISAPYRLYQQTLTIACSNVTAVELYYASSAIINKVNCYCGKQIVNNLKFTYKKGSFPVPEKPKPPPVPVKPVEIPNLPSSPLQKALARLGGHIKARSEKISGT